MCELFASMCVKCTAFVQYLQKPEEGVGVPGTAELLTHATVNNRVWMYFWHSDSILFFWGMLWNSVYLDTTSIAVLKSWQLFFN